MDPDVAEKARGVFAALAVQRTPFNEILSNDFARWRVFFRFMKDSSNDPTTELGALNSTSFLGKHDIAMSSWGKSVKERSLLFKEEFEKFIEIDEVRDALAKDLGVETPPSVTVTVASGSRANDSIARDASRSDERQMAQMREQQPPRAPAVPAPSPPTRTLASPRDLSESHLQELSEMRRVMDMPNCKGEKARYLPDAPCRPRDDHVDARAPRVSIADEPRRHHETNLGLGGDGLHPRVRKDDSPRVSASFHRERVLAYLDGFKTLLLDLRTKVDEIATSTIGTVAGAVERVDSRLETALRRVDAMTIEETERVSYF
jgi:hypothetical protein